MPIDPDTGIFARAWRFVTRFASGDDATLAKLRQDVDGEGGEPPAPLAFAAQLSLLHREGFVGHLLECWVTLLDLCPLCGELTVALRDGVDTLNGGPSVSRLPRVGQGCLGPGPQTHVATPSRNAVAPEPFSCGFLLIQDEAAAVLKLRDAFRLDGNGGQLVARSRHSQPHVWPHIRGRLPLGSARHPRTVKTQLHQCNQAYSDSIGRIRIHVSFFSSAPRSDGSRRARGETSAPFAFGGAALRRIFSLSCLHDRQNGCRKPVIRANFPPAAYPAPAAAN